MQVSSCRSDVICAAEDHIAALDALLRALEEERGHRRARMVRVVWVLRLVVLCVFVLCALHCFVRVRAYLPVQDVFCLV